jgi:hypothetical protein
VLGITGNGLQCLGHGLKQQGIDDTRILEGERLGRPKGKFSSVTKLTGRDDLIREYLAKKIPQSVIARLLNVHRLTVRNYIQTRKLQPSSS